MSLRGYRKHTNNRLALNNNIVGKEVKEDFLDAMVNQAPGAINFTMFLTLFGEKLTG